MRIQFLDRLLSAISGLLVFFLGVCVFVFGIGIFPFKVDMSFFEGSFAIEERLVMIGIALLLGILGIHGLSLLFRRRRDKGFIIQHTELGDMSISMHAMESMVKRCIDTHEELRVAHTRIQRVREGVSVDVRVSLANGVNIPLTVNALQKQIKHYITSCSGVDVKEVRVMVETNNSQQPKSAEVIAPDLVAAEACVAAEGLFGSAHAGAEAEHGKEPIHQRIFKHAETEKTVALPPQEEEMQSVAVEEAVQDIAHEAQADEAVEGVEEPEATEEKAALDSEPESLEGARDEDEKEDE